MKAPPVTERAIHFAVVDLLDRFAAKRGWLYTHFPAGEYRPDRTGSLLAGMGLKRGWPDFILISPDGKPYFLELKSLKGELSPNQYVFFSTMRSRGVHCAVARSVDAAIAILGEWGVVPVTIDKGKAA